MDAENKPAESGTDIEAGIGKDRMHWHLILLVLCAVGVALVIGILALQVTEYLFYKAPPDVWPQSGAADTVNAPLSPVTPTMPSSVPAPVATTTAPSETATSALPVSADKH